MQLAIVDHRHALCSFKGSDKLCNSKHYASFQHSSPSIALWASSSKINPTPADMRLSTCVLVHLSTHLIVLVNTF